jgi:hypothetical protein
MFERCLATIVALTTASFAASAVPARRLPDIKVLSTWVDGQRVYDA